MITQSHSQKKSFFSFIVIATFIKLLLNIAKRLVYPFAPEIARGLQVDLPSITSVIAMGQATAVLGPVGAGFADKYGYRLLMLFAVAIMIIGTFAAGILPTYAMLALCVFLTSLAKNIFDPSLQAYIGGLVPYEHRGKIIGITELAWAGSTLIGVPVTGLIIQKFSWQAPFLVISLLSLASFAILLKIMPGESTLQDNGAGRPSIISAWKQIIQNKKVLIILLFVFFISIANDNLFVVYGIWLETSYSLSLTSIGFGTVLIGLAELSGEGLTTLLSDRVGLKKSIIIGVLICSGAYFIFPLLDRGLLIALAGIFLIFSTFEFTMVTAMSLSTELVPSLRASTMSAFFAIAGLGRMTGAFLGSFTWAAAENSTPMLYICIISGTCMLAAFICLLTGFKKSD